VGKHYRLSYLPLFYQDLLQTLEYITKNLGSPKAAADLLDETEAAILLRQKNPEGYPPYPTAKQRKTDYYRIRVRNYLVFYALIGDVMEVRRFIYARRNIEGIEL